jgi:DNA-binding CsgD family transcriptional regulator/tetratricopeptide (TPR) repeat protein
LLREFLLEKLMALPDADARVRAAVSEACGRGAWDHALSLVVRFALDDLAEPVLANAYKPLSRSGRLATLERFVHAVQARRQQTPRSAQVILAEAAFSDGDLELALDLAEAVLPQLQDDHPAASRAAALVGQIAVLKADFAAGERGFQRAQDVATDERDASEAAYGIATAAVFGEHPAAKGAVKILREARNKSPIDFLRFVTSETALRLLGGIPNGLSGNLHLDAARALLPNADDPRARTGLTYTLASALSQRAQYAEAREWLSLCFADAEKYELEFPLPYANWTLAHVAMGQRRFGEAERALQAIEDVAARKGQPHHALSAQTLRARLLLQTGQPEAALLCVAASPVAPVIPSWRAEYLATRALIHACLGNQSASSEDVGLAEQTSGALQVRGLTQASRAVAGLDDSGRAVREVTQLFSTAARLDVWDPVVCAVRSAPAVADVVAAQVELRPTLEGLCHRTGDVSLGRRMGLRVRSTSKPRDILSPREYEVLELIARGYKNREISRALYIAESTTKVHVRHVLEKLGVRTRAEAAARWQMFERD